ncbi:hypothetical protein B0J13DRAFT_567699 [Dactylonectria estremocensis]|uniref:Uncharacterized protein n=1 Tax=Dactylonectria estremocensis TaxID=1079267 RepID=A0A9P9DJE2_9HYPO|nr:hypothetical protein B0J13DRAFT_567699 [Dactylonectria estremocensis]
MFKMFLYFTCFSSASEIQIVAPFYISLSTGLATSNMIATRSSKLPQCLILNQESRQEIAKSGAQASSVVTRALRDNIR